MSFSQHEYRNTSCSTQKQLHFAGMLTRLFERIAYAETKIDDFRLYLNESCCCTLFYRKLFWQLHEPGAMSQQLLTIDISTILSFCRYHSSTIRDQPNNSTLFKELLSNYFQVRCLQQTMTLEHFESMLRPRYRQQPKTCNHSQHEIDAITEDNTLAIKFVNLIDVIISQYFTVERNRRWLEQQKEAISCLHQKYHSIAYDEINLSQNFLAYLNRNFIKDFMVEQGCYNEITYRKICYYLFGHQHSNSSQFTKALNKICQQEKQNNSKALTKNKSIKKQAFGFSPTEIADDYPARSLHWQSGSQLRQLFEDINRIEKRLNSMQHQPIKKSQQSERQPQTKFLTLQSQNKCKTTCNCQLKNLQLKRIKQKLRQLEEKIENKQSRYRPDEIWCPNNQIYDQKSPPMRSGYQNYEAKDLTFWRYDQLCLPNRVHSGKQNLPEFNRVYKLNAALHELSRAQQQAELRIQQIERRAMIRYLEVHKMPIQISSNYYFPKFSNEEYFDNNLQVLQKSHNILTDDSRNFFEQPYCDYYGRIRSQY